MKIRITGKKIPKAQAGNAGNFITINGVTYQEGQPGYEEAKQQAAQMRQEQQSFSQMVSSHMGMQQPTQAQPQQQTFDLNKGLGNIFNPTGNQSSPYTWMPTGQSLPAPKQQAPAQQQQANPLTFNPLDWQKADPGARINKGLVDSDKGFVTKQDTEQLFGNMRSQGQQLQNTFDTGSAKEIKQGIADYNTQFGTNLKNPNFFTFGAKGRETADKVGKIADMTKLGIGLASSIVGAIDNRKQAKEMDDWRRRQMVTDNLYTADNSEDRGDYNTTGTTYGMFRPNQYVVNKGMYAQDGLQVPGGDMVMRNYMPDQAVLVPAPVRRADVSTVPMYNPQQPFNMPGPSASDTLTYLSHQQGVAGVKAIVEAARAGKEKVGKLGKENIDYNMKNNVYKDFYKTYDTLTPANFLSYWENKFSKKMEEASKTPTKYDEYFQAAGQQTGVNPLLLKTIANVESSFNANANKNKSTRYKGLMQLDVNRFGTDTVFDPFESINITAATLSKNTQQLHFEAGGETDTPMDKIKVRITGSQQMEYGGQFKNGYGLDLGRRNVNSEMPAGPYDSVGNTLQPVPREMANLEAEKGETVYGDINNDGLKEHSVVGGNRHVDGGTPLNLEPGSFIFSDTRKMKIKDPEILKYFNKSYKTGGFTPAAIAKQYDLNRYNAILRDPNADPLAKRTAEKMITNYNAKLGALANIQEGMKGFPQGQPQVYAESLGQAAYGGLAQYQIKGEVTDDYRAQHPELNDFRDYSNFGNFGNVANYYRRQGYTGDQKNVGAWQKWLVDQAQTNPTVRKKLVDYLRSVPLNNYAKDLFPGKKQNDLSDDQLMQQFQDNKFDFRAPKIMMPIEPIKRDRPTPEFKLPPPTYKEIPRETTPDKDPFTPDEIIPGDFTPGKSKIPYGWTNPDKRNFINAGMDYLDIKKYMPWAPKPVLEAPDPTFYDPNRDYAANAEIYNQTVSGAGAFGNPQAYMANVSKASGDALANAANIGARFQNMNVGVANQFGPMRSEINNKQSLMDAQRQKELYDANTVANQQYDNAKMAGHKGILKTWNQGDTNASTLYNMNISESPYYYIDPATQRMQFNSPEAKAAFQAQVFGRGAGASNTGSMGAGANALYKNIYDSLTDIKDDKERHAFAVKLVEQQLGMNSKQTSYMYPNNMRNNKTVTQGYGAAYQSPFDYQ